MTAGGAGGEEGSARGPQTAEVGLAGLASFALHLPLFRKGGIEAVVESWISAQVLKHGRPNLLVKLGSKKILVVTGRDAARSVMGATPDAGGIAAGPAKVKGMSFLAPNALVISHGDEWRSRRALNEQVLDTGRVHASAQLFLDRVVRAFRRPVRSIEDVRAAMSEAMLGIVLGEGAPARMSEDVQAVFAVVPKPLSRLLKGWKLAGRRRRLYDDLRAQWARKDTGPCLLADARAHHPEPTLEMLEQIPHWMFTFPDSGTDLITRTLALIRARPEVAKKVRAELTSAGPLDRAGTIEGLRYVEACLLETGRLYPPVRITTYEAGRAHREGSLDIARGTRIIHHLPVLHRPSGAPPDEESFRPERWLGGGAQPYSLLFLQGPRQCPGRDLITFVCKAAVAQVVSAPVEGAAFPALARDPVPDHFPVEAHRW